MSDPVLMQHVEAHAARISANEAQVHEHSVVIGQIQVRLHENEKQQERTARHSSALTGDISRIREALAGAATKEDVTALQAHIDESVNGLLRDAINSMPGRQANIFALVLVLFAMGEAFHSGLLMYIVHKLF